jgi:hypothetical protein
VNTKLNGRKDESLGIHAWTARDAVSFTVQETVPPVVLLDDAVFLAQFAFFPYLLPSFLQPVTEKASRTVFAHHRVLHVNLTIRSQSTIGPQTQPRIARRDR